MKAGAGEEFFCAVKEEKKIVKLEIFRCQATLFLMRLRVEKEGTVV